MYFLCALFYALIFTSCDTAVVSANEDNQSEESNYSFVIGEINEQYITILYTHEGNPPNIGGFQFNIQGLEQAVLLTASEGAAQENNFTLSTGENIIIGFSLSGSTIPNGSNGDTLTKLFYEGEIINTGLCINNIIISDSQGSEIPTLLIECN
jgi:hypothetical protein